MKQFYNFLMLLLFSLALTGGVNAAQLVNEEKGAADKEEKHADTHDEPAKVVRVTGDEELIKVIQEDRNIRNLEVREITDAGLAHIAGLVNLQALKLSYSEKLTDAGLAPLAGLSNLKELKLNFIFAEQLTDAGMAHIAGLVNLQSLELYHYDNLTGAGLAYLVGLSNLKNLRLFACWELTDASLAHLAQLVNLKTLAVARCNKITDVGLAHLARLVNLQKLNLGYSEKLTDAGLTHLANLINLQELAVPDTKISRESVQALLDELKEKREVMPLAEEERKKIALDLATETKNLPVVITELSTCPLCFDESVDVIRSHCGHLQGCKTCFNSYVQKAWDEERAAFDKIKCAQHNQGCEAFLNRNEVSTASNNDPVKIQKFDDLQIERAFRKTPIGERLTKLEKSQADRLEGQHLKATLLELGYMQCPRCGEGVELKEACNHMTCKCGCQFCYRCGADWYSANRHSACRPRPGYKGRLQGIYQ